MSDQVQSERDPDSSCASLLRWFSSNAGQELLGMEKHTLSQMLPDLFGYHIFQAGGIGNNVLLQSSRINHKIYSSVIADPETGKNPDIFCLNRQLPFANQSIDVVLLPHILEFEEQPHQLLRETERILIGEGHVIILGFSPFSFWGLWRVCLKWRAQPPWNSNTISLSRLKDWLTLLDFEILRTGRFFFRPPSNNEKLMKKLGFLEPLGHYCWPFLGSVYVLLAKKRVISMTPVRMQWQKRRRLIATGMIEPSS